MIYLILSKMWFIFKNLATMVKSNSSLVNYWTRRFKIMPSYLNPCIKGDLPLKYLLFVYYIFFQTFTRFAFCAVLILSAVENTFNVDDLKNISIAFKTTQPVVKFHLTAVIVKFFFSLYNFRNNQMTFPWIWIFT